MKAPGFGEAFQVMKTILTLATMTLAPLLWVNAAEPKETGKKPAVEIEETDLVPSGTYKVTAHRVDPTEKEIYAKTDDGKILELYLQESTKLTKDGEAVEFSELKKGQKLEVTVEKEDDSLKPIAVKILE